MEEKNKNSNIFTIDALYFEPALASIHLVREQNRIAIIDTGTQHSATQVVNALIELGLSFDNVELIILTHIHLDHAGGASALMNVCKNAQLVVHPKGLRHMIDPAKLITGTKAVYGESEYQRLYGEITPIDEGRIISPKDGESLCLGSREFLFIDTPGHANHHHCIIDKQSNSIFTGDTLGIAYQALRDPDHAFILPTTTPVQFNPEELHQSIDRVMSYQPETLYYTHYGALKPSAQNIAGLHEQIDDFVMLTQQVAENSIERLEEKLTDEIFDYLVRRAKNELTTVTGAQIEHWVKIDAKLNAQGLAFWWQHKRST